MTFTEAKVLIRRLLLAALNYLAELG